MTFQRIHSLDSNLGLSDLDAHTLPTQDTASWGSSTILLCVCVCVCGSHINFRWGRDGTILWYLKNFLPHSWQCRVGSGRVCLLAG